MKEKLLIAAVPESLDRLSVCMDGHYDYVVATTFAAARQQLNSQISAIICAMSFDQDRVYDLLRFAKADPETRHIPFLCIKTTDGNISPPLMLGVEIALKALGGDALIDLYDLRGHVGDDTAFEHLRRVIRRTLDTANPNKIV